MFYEGKVENIYFFEITKFEKTKETKTVVSLLLLGTPLIMDYLYYLLCSDYGATLDTVRNRESKIIIQYAHGVNT